MNGGMENALGVLLVAAIMAIIGVIQTLINNIAAASRQRADWKRQDDVAKQAQQAANALVISNERIARETRKTSDALLESGKNIQNNVEAVREIAINTQGLATRTHGMVDGALTTILQTALDGLVRERDLMKRLPDVTKEELESIDRKIAERKIELDERNRDAETQASRPIQVISKES